MTHEMKKLENLKNNQETPTQNHGGRREGAGRKPHSKNAATISREEALRQFRESVARVADQLFLTQLSLARGERFLYHVKWVGKGPKRRKDVAMVDSPEVIKQYLLGELDDDDDNYYYLTTRPANNQALDSLLNRAFGTAQQSIDLTSDSKPLPVPIYGGLSVADRPTTGSRRD